jgi:hypothetical protein
MVFLEQKYVEKGSIFLATAFFCRCSVSCSLKGAYVLVTKEPSFVQGFGFPTKILIMTMSRLALIEFAIITACHCDLVKLTGHFKYVLLNNA